jgi:hypothetical protein
MQKKLTMTGIPEVRSQTQLCFASHQKHCRNWIAGPSSATGWKYTSTNVCVREGGRESVCINSYRWPMFCNMLEFIDQRTADIYLEHTHLRHVRMLLKEPAIAHSQPTAV